MSRGPRTLAEVAAELQRIGRELEARTGGANWWRELEAMVQNLPEPDGDFHSLKELRAAMDCVRRDLLADPVETPETVSASSPIELWPTVPGDLAESTRVAFQIWDFENGEPGISIYGSSDRSVHGPEENLSWDHSRRTPMPSLSKFGLGVLLSAQGAGGHR